jgi:hypothetical protein
MSRINRKEEQELSDRLVLELKDQIHPIVDNYLGKYSDDFDVPPHIMLGSLSIAFMEAFAAVIELTRKTYLKQGMPWGEKEKENVLEAFRLALQDIENR